MRRQVARSQSSKNRPKRRAEDFKALIAGGTLREVEGFSSVTISCDRCHHYERFRLKRCSAAETRLSRSDAVMHVAAYHNSLLHEARAAAEQAAVAAEEAEAAMIQSAQVALAALPGIPT